MPITLSPELEAELQARANASGVSIETYIERIARDDRAAEEELESAAIEGLHSGDSLEGDEPFWSGKRQRLLDRHAASVKAAFVK